MPHATRAVTIGGFGFLLTLAAWQDLSPPRFSAHLEVSIEPRMPARVYLFKNNAPFRLWPVQAVLPIRSDTFYRDRLWKQNSDPDVLEVIASDEYHYILLKGRATFHLPPGKYRMEAYRGMFYTPARVEFELRPDETRRLPLELKPWPSVRPEEWISGDAHIHLPRSRDEDSVYLGWLEAEDLSVGNFLQLQRQTDAAAQYAFGRAGEARRAGYSIRPGQETRNQTFGHMIMTGVNELIRPLSTGSELANAPDDYPFHSLLLDRGRGAGGTVGYAHFRPGYRNLTLLMDLALGKLDFLELFQFGVLNDAEWYELLNAGLRVTGIAGSDFPVPLASRRPWPRWLPLLGPERAMVRAKPGDDPYQAWAKGVRGGHVLLTNGPIVEMTVDEKAGTALANASFFRPLEILEIVRNGHVIAQVPGDGALTSLGVIAKLPPDESCWVAARVRARKLEGEPDIRGHTSPLWVLRANRSAVVGAARQAVAARWEAELARYRALGLVFATEAQRREFFDLAGQASAKLRQGTP